MQLLIWFRLWLMMPRLKRTPLRLWQLKSPLLRFPRQLLFSLLLSLRLRFLPQSRTPSVCSRLLG